MAVVIFLIILVLFLFIDCKMDNVYLKSKNEELDMKISDLANELKVVQDAYAHYIAEEIKAGHLKLDKIKLILPEKEIRRIEKLHTVISK